MTRCEYCDCAVSGTRCENCGAPSKSPPAALYVVGGAMSVIEYTPDAHRHDWRHDEHRAGHSCACGAFRLYAALRARVPPKETPE